MSDYRTLFARVAFEPTEAEVGGKPVLKFRVQVSQVGDTPLIDVTLWEPETTVAQGDFVALNGKYSTRQGQNKEGDPVTYHNISVNEGSIVVLNSSAPPAKPATKKATSKAKAADADLGF